MVPVDSLSEHQNWTKRARCFSVVVRFAFCLSQPNKRKQSKCKHWEQWRTGQDGCPNLLDQTPTDWGACSHKVTDGTNATRLKNRQGCIMVVALTWMTSLTVKPPHGSCRSPVSVSSINCCLFPGGANAAFRFTLSFIWKIPDQKLKTETKKLHTVRRYAGIKYSWSLTMN